MLGKDEARRSVRAVALKPYNLRQTAAVPVASAIDHCEGILFDARGPLQRLVRKVKSKNLVFRFSLPNRSIVHGVYPFVVRQTHINKIKSHSLPTL